MEDIYSDANIVYAWLHYEKLPALEFEEEVSQTEISELLASPRMTAASTWPIEAEVTHATYQLPPPLTALDLATKPLALPVVNLRAESPDTFHEGEVDEEIPNEFIEDPDKPSPTEVPADMIESWVDIAFFWCNMMFEQLEASKTQASKDGEGRRSADRCDNMHVLINDPLIPILGLLEHQYWSRIWIFQEMVLANKIVFLGPRTALDMERFCAVCTWLQAVGDGDILCPPFVHLADWVDWKKLIQFTYMMPLRIKRYKTMVEKIDRSEPKSSIAYLREEVFEVTRNLKATNPRDHVYGIAGVLDVRFKADYGRSVEDVYTAWACWLAHTAPTLDFLNQAGLGQSKEHEYSLPSWVPDWSSTLNLGYGSSGFFAAAKLEGEFGFMKKHVKQDIKQMVLVADGVIVDEVLSRRSDGKDMALMLYHHLLAHGHPTGDPPLQVLFRTITSDNTNADACKSGIYDRYNAKLLVEFIRFASLLMLLDNPVTRSDNEPFALLDQENLAWDPASWAMNEYFDLQPRPKDSPKNRWNPLALLWDNEDNYSTYNPDIGDAVIDQMLKETPSVSSPFGNSIFDRDEIMTMKLEDSHLFRTRNGYIGNSGSDVQAGDKICVLAWCSYPLVMRPIGEHFVIIEQCFVHGLMYGQVAQDVSEGRHELSKFEIH
jgi:hypothetical protein